MKDTAKTPDTNAGRTVGKLELFMGFAEMALGGFGGVATMARHVIVDRRRWMSEREYAEVIGMGQILPGGNILNMSVMVGDRFQGPLGAVIALSGLMIIPILILIGLTMVYELFAANADVQAATIGAGAAAAGLVIGMGIKMGRNLRLEPMHLGFAVATFLAMGVLRLPFVGTILVLAPICFAATWWRRRK